jgi:hypothetical protein
MGRHPVLRESIVKRPLEPERRLKVADRGAVSLLLLTGITCQNQPETVAASMRLITFATAIIQITTVINMG